MPIIEQIGINATAPAGLNITLPSGVDIISEIPVLANQNTNHLLAILILGFLWVFLYWTLSERSQFSELKYNDPRAVNLAFGMCAIFGITNIQIGFYTNLQSVMMFISLFMLSWIAIFFYENRE
jgi:hypothetical protein